MDAVEALPARLQAAGEKRTAAGAIDKPAPLTDLALNASVLNAANAGNLAAVLSYPAADPGAVLTSDADEQLMLSLTLPQTYRLTSIKLSGPAGGSAPATVKLFTNRSVMSFDDVEDYVPTQV